MRLIICFILPWLGFLTIKKPFAALICLILQITLIGWYLLWFGLSMLLINTKLNKKSQKP
ncbi:YqaE/Pmp3 family membrane protein [Campylobacter sp. 2018MI35]|uniref:YqaE/Pmp3 family membrane protein n=1 Tax=Campylobacter sp. 2018MI34 TaxID=2800582 RepID=UPI0019080D09|nr:YqaE/Pmp3 family membrane protein [Campylobacter sp. 2018MI34]MBK1991882.1 YqaE/Pmp3 family membrane protein [Campylobacter sp. 2018MI34]